MINAAQDYLIQRSSCAGWRDAVREMMDLWQRKTIKYHKTIIKWHFYSYKLPFSWPFCWFIAFCSPVVSVVIWSPFVTWGSMISWGFQMIENQMMRIRVEWTRIWPRTKVRPQFIQFWAESWRKKREFSNISILLIQIGPTKHGRVR